VLVSDISHLQKSQRITLLTTMLSQARVHDHTGYDCSLQDLDRLSSDYENSGQAIYQLLKELE
jgi:hypothetical protein